MGDREYHACSPRTLGGCLIAGPDVDVLGGQLPCKASKGSGHIGQCDVEHQLLVARNSFAGQRLFGLFYVIDDELYVRSEERREGKSVDLGGRRIIKKKKKKRRIDREKDTWSR